MSTRKVLTLLLRGGEALASARAGSSQHARSLFTTPTPTSNVQAPSWFRPSPRLKSIPNPPPPTAPLTPPSASASAEAQSLADGQRMAERLMFPWERRQLGADQAPGLRLWEKAYWGVFAVVAFGLVFTNIGEAPPAPPPDFEAIRRKRRLAAQILAGPSPGSVNFAADGVADAFSGMDRREVDRFLRAEAKRLGLRRRSKSSTAHRALDTTGVEEVDEGADPFEGLSEAEIEALVDGDYDERDPANPKYRDLSAEERRMKFEPPTPPPKLGARIRSFLGLSGKRKEEDESGKENGVKNAEGVGSGGADGDEFEGMSPEEIDAMENARRTSHGEESGAYKDLYVRALRR